MRNRECGLKCFVRYSEVLRPRPAHEGIECWVGLNAEQVDALFGDGAEPDVYLKRFGLGQTPAKALGRAAEFLATTWSE